MNIRWGFLLITLILATSCGCNAQTTIGKNIEQQPTLLPTFVSITNYPNISLSGIPNLEVNESKNHLNPVT